MSCSCASSWKDKCNLAIAQLQFTNGKKQAEIIGNVLTDSGFREKCSFPSEKSKIILLFFVN